MYPNNRPYASTGPGKFVNAKTGIPCTNGNARDARLAAALERCADLIEELLDVLEGQDPDVTDGSSEEEGEDPSANMSKTS